MLQRSKRQADKDVSKAIENTQEQVAMAAKDNDVERAMTSRRKSKSAKQKERRSRMKTVNDRTLARDSRKPVNVEGIIIFLVPVGDLRVREWFGGVEKLAVSVILGTTFINRVIKRIFPPEPKIVLFHSKPVEILASRDGTVKEVIDEKASETNKGQNKVLFGVSQQKPSRRQ